MGVRLRLTALIAIALIPRAVFGQILSDDALEFSCLTFPTALSHADLVERFGATNVVEAPLRWGGEYQGPGTVLFPNSVDARLEIIWQDQEQKRTPGRVRVRAGHSERWRAPNGVTVGTDLRALERANRKPFRLAGFQTELMGAVRSWSGGNLELPEAKGCRITIHLQPPYDTKQDFAVLRQVKSGREYSSDHPAMQELNPRVVSMVLHSFGPDEDFRSTERKNLTGGIALNGV